MSLLFPLVLYLCLPFFRYFFRSSVMYVGISFSLSLVRYFFMVLVLYFFRSGFPSSFRSFVCSFVLSVCRYFCMSFFL